MNVNRSEIADLCIDYMLVSTGSTTTTGLSSLTDEIVSEGKTTRILKVDLFNSAGQWKASGS